MTAIGGMCNIRLGNISRTFGSHHDMPWFCVLHGAGVEKSRRITMGISWQQ